MAKVIIRTESDGKRIENEEEIFKLSNDLSTEIKVNCSDEIFEKIKLQTFYITFDLTNNLENDFYDLYTSIFPTPIFKESKKNFKFGTCRHVLSNIIHYDNAIYIHYESDINSLLPSGWSVSYIKSSDYPIGNDLIPNYFNEVCDLSIHKYIESDYRFNDSLPPTRLSDVKRIDILNKLLSYIYEPATKYDTNSYNYLVSRREIGKLVRQQAFNIVKGKIHLIGPEMESIKNVVLYLNVKGNTISFYTLNTSRKTSYLKEKETLKTRKVTWRNILHPQYKNMNNFFKGLISHINKNDVTVEQVYYIGSYPSYWLETLDWINFNIICYDPKYRKVENDMVIWRDKLFTDEEIDMIPENTYVYVDIRSDSRKKETREQILHDEDNFIISIMEKLLLRKCTVMAKRKIFEGNNIIIGQICFPPSINQLGREYYCLATSKSIKTIVSEQYLYNGLLAARYNNVANYVFGGIKFDSGVDVSDGTVIALYSISNAINSLSAIKKCINNKHIITFPTGRTGGDWRQPDNEKSVSFPGKIEQNQFIDWYVNPKSYSIEYNVEIMSESVFLQYCDDRAFIPDLYNHMISSNILTKMINSDLYFSHIGIRQPSIFLRDKYMTSRLSAYISRRLTHSIDLTPLEKNKFEGYSGHLIAIETSFNSLVDTMSPYRWIVRNRNILWYGKRRDKFKLGAGQPHTREEYDNTYVYLEDNELIKQSFKKILTADALSK
nr:VP3 [Bat RVJ-like rotavirus BtSY2]